MRLARLPVAVLAIALVACALLLIPRAHAHIEAAEYQIAPANDKNADLFSYARAQSGETDATAKVAFSKSDGKFVLGPSDAITDTG